MTRDKILSQVHSKPEFHRYNETIVRDNTNCYSHALGATFPELKIYRVGAICGKKEINEKYTSDKEIEELLFLDCKELQLEIKKCSLEDEISDDEHKIILFFSSANGLIGYHFWRYDNELLWTEKWRGRGMNKIQNFQRDILKFNYFPWNFVGIYKISKQRVQ